MFFWCWVLVLLASQESLQFVPRFDYEAEAVPWDLVEANDAPCSWFNFAAIDYNNQACKCVGDRVQCTSIVRSPLDMLTTSGNPKITVKSKGLSRVDKTRINSYVMECGNSRVEIATFPASLSACNCINGHISCHSIDSSEEPQERRRPFNDRTTRRPSRLPYEDRTTRRPYYQPKRDRKPTHSSPSYDNNDSASSLPWYESHETVPSEEIYGNYEDNYMRPTQGPVYMVPQQRPKNPKNKQPVTPPMRPWHDSSESDSREQYYGDTYMLPKRPVHLLPIQRPKNPKHKKPRTTTHRPLISEHTKDSIAELINTIFHGTQDTVRDVKKKIKDRVASWSTRKLDRCQDGETMSDSENTCNYCVCINGKFFCSNKNCDSDPQSLRKRNKCNKKKQTKPAGDGCNVCKCYKGEYLCTLKVCGDGSDDRALSLRNDEPEKPLPTVGRSDDTDQVSSVKAALRCHMNFDTAECK